LYLHSLFVHSETEWQKIRQQRLFPIQKPATVARASSGDISARLAASSSQFAHMVRRSWFHGIAALKYVWGLPEWRRGSKTKVLDMNPKRAGKVTLAPGSTSGE